VLSRRHVSEAFGEADRTLKVVGYHLDALADFESALKPHIVPPRDWAVGISYPHVRLSLSYFRLRCEHTMCNITKRCVYIRQYPASGPGVGLSIVCKCQPSTTRCCSYGVTYVRFALVQLCA
jgi:hypothetical protein